MERNISEAAIVLKNYPYGEIHQGVVLLTPVGKFSTVAYGARKGRLKGRIEPLNGGRAYIYRDFTRDRNKLSDFDVKETFDGVRGHLIKWYTACLWSEILLHVFPLDDEARRVFLLFYNGLRKLESASEGNIGWIDIQFLWHWLDAAGFRPDLAECARSGVQLAAEQKVCYSPRLQGVVEYEGFSEGMTELSPESRHFLLGLEDWEDSAAGLVGRHQSEIRRFLREHVESCLDEKLKTLASAGSILSC